MLEEAFPSSHNALPFMSSLLPSLLRDRKFTFLGCYSETGFHIGTDGNFVCLWRRHDCKSQVNDLSLSALIS
jgi:hypothetical protein